jgi:pyocin large subunit-like protein
MMKAMWLAGAASALLLLAGCDGGPSAVAARDHSAGAAQAAAEIPSERESARREEGASVARVSTPTVDGKPLWSATRKLSAEENAERVFERNGEDFDAADLDAFVKKAHAFVDHPPKGAETLKRANGDVLIYDAKSNTFAVATKDGAPRTMFKPRDGAAYWDEQKSREEGRAQQRAQSGPSDDNG